MTEAELQTAVADWARRLGLWCLEIGDPRRATPGWPDLFVLGRGALAIELKSDTGRRTLQQINVATKLAAAGIPYRLWRPADWEEGTICRQLEALI